MGRLQPNRLERLRSSSCQVPIGHYSRDRALAVPLPTVFTTGPHHLPSQQDAARRHAVKRLRRYSLAGLIRPTRHRSGR